MHQHSIPGWHCKVQEGGSRDGLALLSCRLTSVLPAPGGRTLSVAPESPIAYSGGGEAREWGDSAVGKMRRERASMLLAALLLMVRGRV